MFQGMHQIQRIKNSTNQLQKQKKQLKQLIHKTSKKPNEIQNQVDYCIDKVISNARQKLELCEKLQDQVQNENFISSNLQFTQLIDQSRKLPQWFQHVCHSEFLKQKKNISTAAIKLYRQAGLAQKKKQLQNQINNFASLNNRYNELNKNQKGSISLNSQIQMFQNKTNLIFSRFVNFIELVGQKITFFVQAQARKSLNYVSEQSKIPLSTPQNNQYNDNENQDIILRNYYNKVASLSRLTKLQPPLCFHHPNNFIQQYRYQPQYYQTMNPMKNEMPCKIHKQQPRPNSVRINKYQRSQSPFNYNQYENRFNYRDHVPKRNMITTTLSNFYRE